MSDSEPDAPKPTAAAPSAKPNLWLWDRLIPDWVAQNCKSRRAIKVFIRCLFASWISLVIILPNASLQAIGSAAFFSLLASFFLPPFLPVQLFLLLISTLVIGLLLGWAVGSAAMKAAVASRSQEALQAASQQVQQMIQSNPAFQANPALAQTTAVFNGVFLDVRSSAVYGCFLLVGCFLFGLMRAYLAQLTFMSIFGTIGLTIFCSVGPLLPTTQYTIINSVIISVACFIAIAIFSTLSIFPETMNHSSLADLSGQLGDVKTLLEMQGQVLKSAPEDLAMRDKEGGLWQRTDGLRTKIILTHKKWRSTLNFLSVEFSWGKWSGDDIRAIAEPVLAVMSRIGGLQSFAKLVGDSSQSSVLSADAEKSALSIPSTHDTYLVRQLLQQNHDWEAKHGVKLSDTLSILEDSTLPLRKACIEGVVLVQGQIEWVNENRWNWKQDTTGGARLDELNSAIENLRDTLEEFKSSSRLRLLEPYAPFFAQLDSASAEARPSIPLRTLFISYVFTSVLLVTAEAILSLLGTVYEISEKRKKNRLWGPTKLRQMWKLLRMRGDDKAREGFGDDAAKDDDVDSEEITSVDEPASGEEKVIEEKRSRYRLDPDSKPPTLFVQKIMNTIHLLYKWTKTPEGLFTFKYAIITIALWIPGVVPSFANFYFVEKGVWALIMAQTTLNIYAGDQIFNLFARLIGTIAGLAFGLAAWYIGNGNGNGNPYGAAASTALFLIPLVFARLYAPPVMLPGVILCCATFSLIVGFSWVDGHVAQFSSPGIGWSVGWKRFVLVVIGAGASFVIMMLPPSSSRKAVRLKNAKTIDGLAKLYTFLIEHWISPSAAEPAPNSNAKQTTLVTAKWMDHFRVKLLALADQIGTIRQLTGLAKWEGSIRGAWPSEAYIEMVEVERTMISSLALLGGALGHLDDKWRREFLVETRVLNPHFISDVMSIFGLVSQSLRTGQPMHQVLPSTLLDRFLYHQHRRPSGENTPEPAQVSSHQLRSMDYVFYATGVVSVHQLLLSLDDLHRITRGLCGEVPLKGFADWKNEYERQHTL